MASGIQRQKNNRCKIVIRTAAIFIFAMLVLASCTKEKKSDKNLQITGTIKGLKKGKLYIQKLQDSTLVVLDSIIFNGNSTFESHLDLESPEMLYFFLDRGVTQNVDNSLMVFAEPGKLNIDTTLELFYAKAKITGSKNNDLYEEFKKVNARYTTQKLDILAEKVNAGVQKKEFSEEEGKKREDAVLRRSYLYAINFAVNHKDYEIAPYIALSEFSNANIRYLDTVQKSMTPKVAKSKYGKMLTEYVAGIKKENPEKPEAIQ